MKNDIKQFDCDFQTFLVMNLTFLKTGVGRGLKRDKFKHILKTITENIQQ